MAVCPEGTAIGGLDGFDKLDDCTGRVGTTGFAGVLDAKRPEKWITPAKLGVTDGTRGVIRWFRKLDNRTGLAGATGFAGVLDAKRPEKWITPAKLGVTDGKEG